MKSRSSYKLCPSITVSGVHMYIIQTIPTMSVHRHISNKRILRCLSFVPHQIVLSVLFTPYRKLYPLQTCSKCSRHMICFCLVNTSITFFANTNLCRWFWNTNYFAVNFIHTIFFCQQIRIYHKRTKITVMVCYIHMDFECSILLPHSIIPINITLICFTPNWNLNLFDSSPNLNIRDFNIKTSCYRIYILYLY